jgi:DNA-binding transcriptional MocR family regulator
VAYLSLSPAGRAVHVELVRLYNGGNNGRLALSVRVAANRCRIARNTAARAFVELQDRGFIELVTRGGFSLKTRHAAEWRLTHLPCHASGQLPHKSFMRWRPSEKQSAVSTRAATVANESQSADV